jgi:hypothetical protein
MNALPSQANYFVYLRPELITDMLRKLAAPSLSGSGFSFSPVILHLSFLNGKLLTSGSWQKGKSTATDQQVAWTALLDSALASAPVVVINHNTGEEELVVQDQADFIYLLDNKGNVLWKKKTDGSIIGQVQQMDFLNNGKLQLLFNTQRFIYLVDRNGNDVPPFPIKLKAYATNQVMTTNYSSTSDHRFFIACTDGVYACDNQGRWLEGWSPRKFLETPEITSPVMYAQADGADFLVVSGSLSNLQTKVSYMLNRRGEEKMPVLYWPTNTLTDPQLVQTANGTALFNINSEGMATQRMLNGETNSWQLNQPCHGFTTKSATGTIWFYNNQTVACANDSTILWEFELPESVASQLAVHCRAADDCHTALITSSGNLYLLNSNGTLIEGFPVAGEHGIAMLSKETDLLVTVNGQSLVAYRIAGD